MGGWVDEKAILRIAYCNLKFILFQIGLLLYRIFDCKCVLGKETLAWLADFNRKYFYNYAQFIAITQHDIYKLFI